MLIQKEWKILDERSGSAPLPERILQNRQLGEGLMRERFLHPRLEDLYDPFLLPDMAALAGSSSLPSRAVLRLSSTVIMMSMV